MVTFLCEPRNRLMMNFLYVPLLNKTVSVFYFRALEVLNMVIILQSDERILKQIPKVVVVSHVEQYFTMEQYESPHRPKLIIG